MQQVKYIISGTAWIDKNQDGIRQIEEEFKDEVKVSLYKANSNGGLDTTNVVAETTTNKQGVYLFEGVEKGNYIIVFDYDSEQFKLTK